jgi:hypothetical protein
MRPLPRLGEQREEWEHWVCGYSATPADPACHRDATWHGFVLDDPCEHIAAMMSCCDDHLPQMKLTADYAHRLRHPCAIPGSFFRWPENECYTEWDETAELAAASEMAAAGETIRA